MSPQKLFQASTIECKIKNIQNKKNYYKKEKSLETLTFSL